MINMAMWILAVIGALALIMIFIISICIATAPHDRTDEDREQMNFLRGYYQRKDDNNE